MWKPAFQMKMNSALEEVSEEKGAAFGKLFSHQENSLDPIVSEHKATQSEEITVDTNTQKSAEPEEPPEASPEKPIPVSNETSKEENPQQKGMGKGIQFGGKLKSTLEFGQIVFSGIEFSWSM